MPYIRLTRVSPRSNVHPDPTKFQEPRGFARISNRTGTNFHLLVPAAYSGKINGPLGCCIYGKGRTRVHSVAILGV